MGVSKNNGTPKSSILIGFPIINHPFWGTPVPLFLETSSSLHFKRMQQIFRDLLLHFAGLR